MPGTVAKRISTVAFWVLALQTKGVYLQSDRSKLHGGLEANYDPGIYADLMPIDCADAGDVDLDRRQLILNPKPYIVVSIFFSTIPISPPIFHMLST